MVDDAWAVVGPIFAEAKSRDLKVIVTANWMGAEAGQDLAQGLLDTFERRDNKTGRLIDYGLSGDASHPNWYNPSAFGGPIHVSIASDGTHPAVVSCSVPSLGIALEVKSVFVQSADLFFVQNKQGTLGVRLEFPVGAHSGVWLAAQSFLQPVAGTG